MYKIFSKTIVSIIFTLFLASCSSHMLIDGSSGAKQASFDFKETVTVKPQQSWHDAVLYFVILDRFADGDKTNNKGVELSNPGGWHGGDIKGLTEKLDYLADLGVTALWITPVNKQIVYAPWAMGDAGSGYEREQFQHHGFHGYWADDFTSIDEHFGDEKALKNLVDEAHKRNIKVLLDVVYNHAGYGARYEESPDFNGWIRRNAPDCSGAEDIECAVGGLPDFLTEKPIVRKYLVDNHVSLAKKTGLDGFRLDTLKHVEHDFWQYHRQVLDEEISKDFFLLGELWGAQHDSLKPWYDNREVDSGFEFAFKGACEGFVKGRGRAAAYAHYLNKRHKKPSGYVMAHYLSSHDEPMSIYNLDYDKSLFKICVGLQMSTIGMPVIYYGEELGRNGTTWPNNRTNMPWGDGKTYPGHNAKPDVDMLSYYKALIKLRRDNPALWKGTFKRISEKRAPYLILEKQDTDSTNAAIIFVNREERAYEAVGELSQPLHNGQFINGLGDGVKASFKHEVTATIPPKSFSIFIKDPK